MDRRGSHITSLLKSWIASKTSFEGMSWLESRLILLENATTDRELYITFGRIPGRLGKTDLNLSEDARRRAAAARPGWDPRGWSVDGAARVLALLSTAKDGEAFAGMFKRLRVTSDPGELVALYRGLPLYPAANLEREAEEGLRTAMRPVFEAVAHRSPYPRERFDEPTWNQMVLKALFIDSRLAPIQGLDERANPELARIMLDFAHERRAAGRSVPFEIWRCVGPFANTLNGLDDLSLALAGDGVERRAAALALSRAPGGDALLASVPDLKSRIETGALTWDSLSAAA